LLASSICHAYDAPSLLHRADESCTISSALPTVVFVLATTPSHRNDRD
jgi:hypothetical protein